MEELWKDIEGFEGLYQISTNGRVRGFVRVKGKILSPHKNEDGYLQIRLHKDGKKYSKYVHRLVAMAFIPNPKNLPEVNHKDENKRNNSVNNLEWCTHEYNITYGTCQKRSSDSYAARTIPILMFDLEGHLLARFDNFRQIEQELGFDHSTISSCCNGRYKTSHGYIWLHETDMSLLMNRLVTIKQK